VCATSRQRIDAASKPSQKAPEVGAFRTLAVCSIASLDRVLLCMYLIVFEGQKLTIGIVDDKRVNIQSMKMRP
jgi:hypothetical protein